MATMKGTDPSHDNRLKAPCNVSDSGVDACKEKVAWLSPGQGPSFSVFLGQPNRLPSDKLHPLLPPVEFSKAQSLFRPLLLS